VPVLPGIYYDVKRRLNTVARGFTDRGDPVQSWGRRSPRCLQHETDHLDGVLFSDRMDAATRKLAMREIQSIKVAYADEDEQASEDWPHTLTSGAGDRIPYTLRRKLQVTGPKCGYWLVTIPSTEVGGFPAGLSYAGGMQHVTTGAPWRTRS